MGVIVPNQNARPVDDGSTLFNPLWWLFFNNLADAINLASNGGGGGAGVSAIFDVVLSTGSTVTCNPSSPNDIGSMLYVFVNSAGPTAVLAWGANVKWAPTELDSVANTWTVFSLVGRIDPADTVLKWFYVGIGVTGQPS